MIWQNFRKEKTMKKLLGVLLGLMVSVCVAFGYEGEFEIEKNVRIDFFIKYPQALEAYEIKFLDCIRDNSMPYTYQLLGLQLREVDEDAMVNAERANEIKTAIRTMFRYYVENNGVMDKYISLKNKEALIKKGYNLIKSGNAITLRSLISEYQIQQEKEIEYCGIKHGRFKEGNDPFLYEGKWGKTYKKFEKEWKKEQLEKLGD